MKTTMKHKWQDVLLRAASIVEEGWCQGTFHLNKDGVDCFRPSATRSCAAGAISRAAAASGVGMPYSASPVEIAALRELTRFLDGPSIAAWNDHPVRTAVEVAETMRQAAT